MINLNKYEYIGDNKYTVNKYKLLGSGRSSIVLEGYDNINKCIVAIKKMNTREISIIEYKFILNEIKIMNYIKQYPNNNIIKCYDVINENNIIYIILEYCDSGDLTTLLGRPVDENNVRNIFKQILRGLQYLLDNNISHNDMKPKNILLTLDNQLKICDFGFSKFNDDSNNVTTNYGSPLYMAPELINNNYISELYNTNDQWSIGIILFELLFGYHPLENCSDLLSLQNIIKNDFDIFHIIEKETSKTQISQLCKNILILLLQPSHKRVSWDLIFNHKWITDDKISIIINNIKIQQDEENRNLQEFDLNKSELFEVFQIEL
jgi:serine/threonine protein kinase